MKYKAVIFDLDGTLLYTLGDIADATNNVLKTLNIPSIPEEDYKKLVGHGLREALKRAVHSYNIPESTFDDAYLNLLEEYRQNCVGKTRFYKGVPELLDEISSLDVQISVLSNKEDELVQKIVGKLLTPWRFISIQGTKSKIKKKPDPEAVFNILKAMNLKPEDAIFMGDSGVDMKTAVNSGLTAVGVTWGYRDRNELLDAGAKILIDKPVELLRILDSEQ